MDVVAWLRGLGLERYAPAFRDNDIDGEVLPELTSHDLISIGVTSVGHRRKLLAAIASLGATPPVATEMAATRDAPVPADAERRQLTVMFCDLVGSTELSARLDPEDLRDVIAACHRAVADVVRSFDGFIAKYMGDGERTKKQLPCSPSWTASLRATVFHSRRAFGCICRRAGRRSAKPRYNHRQAIRRARCSGGISRDHRRRSASRKRGKEHAPSRPSHRFFEPGTKQRRVSSRIEDRCSRDPRRRCDSAWSSTR
jgi:SAM domain (Sterile alpha motif)